MFSLSLETEAAEHAVSEPGPFTQNAPVQILAQALTSSLILSEWDGLSVLNICIWKLEK